MSLFSSLRTLLVLGRVSNLPTVWTNVAAGWFLTGGGWTSELGWLVLGISFLYVGGMTLNDAFDAKWDRENAPSRPIPSGRISVPAVWLTGTIQLTVGFKTIAFLTTMNIWLLAGLLAAVVLYDWVHKRWAGSVLVMGLCRALVYVGAGTATGAVRSSDVSLPGSLWVLAGAVVLYIAGLTLAARSEHLGRPGPMLVLPRLLLTLPVLYPLIASRPLPDSPMKYGLIVTGIIVIWAWLAIVRSAYRERIPKGIAFAIAGIALFDASVVVFHDWPAAVACLGCFGITLVAQRYIPAT